MIALYLAIECVILCALMWLICFIGTGGDKKNLANIYTYPDEVINQLKNNENFKDIIPKPANPAIKMATNIIIYTIILFTFGLFIKTDSFLTNFLYMLLLGEVVNAFDLLVIDALWWRNTPRIRFSCLPQKELYKDMKKHLISFCKGAAMFVVVALITGGLLLLF